MRPTDILNESLRCDLERFDNMLWEMNYHLPAHVQMALYKRGSDTDIEKLFLFFKKSLPCVEMQEKVLQQDNLVFIEKIADKWAIDARCHYILIKKDIKILKLVFVKTKLCLEPELKFCKTREKDAILVYKTHQKFSQKASNLLKGIKKI